MWGRIRFLILTLLLASCADGTLRDRLGMPMTLAVRPMPWRFSCSFPDKLKPEVRSGFEYWNRLSGKQLFTENKECGSINNVLGIWVDISAGQPAADERRATQETLAETLRFGGPGGLWVARIVFYRAFSEEDSLAIRLSTARHEAGHALGMAHRSWPGCLMYHLIDAWWANAIGPKEACLEELLWLRKNYR